MDGGHQIRAGFRIHFSPCEPCEPCGNSGAEVDDIRAFLFEKSAQYFNLLQRAQALLVHGEVDVSASLCLKLFDKSAAIGDDDGFVPLLNKVLSNF